MFCSAGSETESLITIFSVLAPTVFYIMGLMEGKKGHYFFLAGIFLHLISMGLRGLALKTIPLTEKHDNISFMAFSMSVSYLYFHRKSSVKNLSMVALPLISAFMFVSAINAPVNTVSPFLKSPWFYLHIFFYFIGYGFFGISACIGFLYVIGREKENELLQYRAAINGWIMFSISLVLGSIWFYVAYGTYWLWTSRELWTTLTWFFYGLYLHARYIKGLSGRPSAILGILGFLAALFAYFGVGTVIPSPPTQF